MSVGADGNGDALPPGAHETTEDAGPSPSQVGEDEETRDDVLRGVSSRTRISPSVRTGNSPLPV